MTSVNAERKLGQSKLNFLRVKKSSSGAGNEKLIEKHVSGAPIGGFKRVVPKLIGDGISGNQVGPVVKKEKVKVIRKEIEEKLKGFDMDASYGPCIGITRLERWNRAKKFGLDPPIEIREILEDGNCHDHSAWDDLLNRHHRE
mmetsp:Transcript_16332/g.40274  ORF Transcript_16332/g.40274 Transcript_16332/m.40274 type:complete len:143 (-) Transcript_16332:204-632(-)|eukprot:CAMPEP_0114509042 /NCGR_PEP_ID=MMETSP0109-20121206/12978_1 /TAXON_ID=29199 /ORGANISM="Chlorarachnion reptans, Strain CCCM449" /LENGTH=142 /DNA_ID=CAMNT_0001688127 /DNA_START=133 /DNA_END=561 /DNA_ORIENTATION=+